MIVAIKRFLHDRRGAIAIIFAASLLPLAMLVGLSIDFSFYTQARAQIALAADAASTHAIRAATETYTTEINENPAIGTTQATTDAISAGETAGKLWFSAQLGTLGEAQISNGNPVVTVSSNNSQEGSTNPAGFTAAVTYTGTYPPFFDPLFSSTANWTIKGTAGALSTYSYVEILMMLDNSGSMDIGATPQDIQTLELNTTCVPSPWNDTGGNTMSPTYDTNDPADPNNPPLAISLANEKHYNVQTNRCASGYGGQAKAPFSPCGFACHTNTSNEDYYGIARANHLQLRIDVVLSAAENVISSMDANEQAPGQFSVGVYQFNSDISPLFPAATGNTANNAEASTDLSAALSAVDAIDYNKTPTETVEPPLQSPNTPCCNTDLPTAVSDLLNGTYSDGTRFGPKISAAGSGSTAAAPQKDIFIVTDGFQDSGSGSSRVSGEMTGVAAETFASNYPYSPGVCKNFKSMGFTVYVLYIEYNPLPNYYYLGGYGSVPTSYFRQDYPHISNPSPQDYAEPTSVTNNGNPPGPTTVSPDVAALQACASSPSDFFSATSAADISTAMNAMLKSAISSTIRVTQ